MYKMSHSVHTLFYHTLQKKKMMTLLFDSDDTDDLDGDAAVAVRWGYFCALLATVFFGSFAVPIKTPAIVRANVDPVAVR